MRIDLQIGGSLTVGAVREYVGKILGVDFEGVVVYLSSRARFGGIPADQDLINQLDLNRYELYAKEIAIED